MSTTAVPPHVIVTRPGRTPHRRASSAYVDVFWTPIVGGTGVATYRALTRLAAANPGGTILIEDLAELIGERSPDASQRVWRAIGSLEAEGVLTRAGTPAIEVPIDLPILRADQTERLPHAVREIHPAWLTMAQIDDLYSAAMDGFVAAASFLDEALADRTCSPLRSIQRWQQAIRTASDFHDDMLIDITPPQYRSAARQLGERCRSLLDEVRRAQRDLLAPVLAVEGSYPELRRAIGAVSDWINGQESAPNRVHEQLPSADPDRGTTDLGGVDEPVDGREPDGGLE